MRLAALVILASCTKSVQPPGSELTRSMWQTAVTPLEVIVFDDYPTKESCPGVAPHRIEVSLDGRAMTTVEVPCSTTVRVPPSQFKAASFEVGPGKHVVRVRELASGIAGELELELPVIDPPFGEADDDAHRVLATKLPVWANDEELDIQGLRAVVIVM